LKRKVALLGFYGFGNSGDEAVLCGILQALNRAAANAGKEVEVTVLSADISDTVKRHKVSAVNRMNLVDVFNCLRSCDALIVGGGSLFQDVTGRGLSVIYYAGVSILAALMRKRVIFYAQGIGPIKKRFSKVFFYIAANVASLISVRDTGSLMETRRFVKRRKQIILTADPAFAVTFDRDSAIKREVFSRLPKQPLLGVMLRDWPGLEDTLSEAVHTCAKLSEELGLKIVLVPMHKDKDLLVCRRMAGWLEGKPMIIEDDLTPAQMMALFERFDLVLAMRLHALIFAAIAGTPMLGIGYDPKVNAFLAQMGMPLSSDSALVSEKELVEQGLRLWEERDSIKEKLLEKSKESKDEAFEFANRVVEELWGGTYA